MDDSSSGEPAATTDPPVTPAPVEERLSRCGTPVMFGAPPRRSRLLYRGGAAAGPDRASIKPALAAGSGSTSCAPPREQDPPWALYPMEHAWMLSAVEGNCDTLLEFVSEDPVLLTRRDFVSGYSVLHWLAKLGRDDTLLKLLHHAEKAGGARVSVDVRGSGGLTPLHVASMHGRYAVVKLLVGAFGANVDAMDYSGRRAWHYLRPDAPAEMKELLGMWDDEHAGRGAPNANKNSNNSSVTEDVDGRTERVGSFDRMRGGSRRFGSLKRIFSFRANRR